MKTITFFKIIALFFFTSLFGSWCDYCGKPLKKDFLTLKLENNNTRKYDTKACEALDIKRYGFKKDLNISLQEIKRHQNYLKNIKEKKIYQVGKKIYKKRCQKDIDLEFYLDISELENDLYKKYCKKLDKIRTWYVATYLWDKLHHSLVEESKNQIKITKKEKCPVCGMFVYKYPRWASQIWYKNKTHHSFDGVKCMLKYYFFYNKDKIEKILVTDYYKQIAIDAKKAYFVFGSDVFGPMGKEAIPFEELDDAKNFLKDHRGKKILRFDNITKKDLKALDE